MIQSQDAGDVLVKLFAFIEILGVSCRKFNDRDITLFAPLANERILLSLSFFEQDPFIDSVDCLKIAADLLHDEQKSGLFFCCM